MEKYTTNSNKETQGIGENFAQEILAIKPAKHLPHRQTGAVVLALSGDLSAGKTTFLQGFARGLGITEVVNSPTFIIMKKFKIPKNKRTLINDGRRLLEYGLFYHVDCYRLESPEEILQLGFEEIVLDPTNIIAIEWSKKIAKLLPKDIILIKFKHLEESKRELTIGT